MWVQLAILLGSILVGARMGGVGLGTTAGVGLAVLVFGMGAPVGKLPIDVIFIILTVITAVSSLAAAGGLELLVEWAAALMRKRPRAITFVAPVVAYVFTVFCGTEHVVYSLLPVIAEVARNAGVRPERPISAAVIAAQQGITASPISAATAGMVALAGVHGSHYGLSDVLFVCVPATLCGILVGALSVARRGVELADDPVYQQRLRDGGPTGPASVAVLTPERRQLALRSLAIFLGAAVVIVVFGLVPSLRPIQKTSPEVVRLSMAMVIEIVMLVAAALILFVTRSQPDQVIASPIMRAGSVALVSIFGIAWLGSTFFEANRATIVGALADFVGRYPWVFALALFALSILLFSQAATVAAFMHVGVELGLGLPQLIGMFPAVNGFFFLGTYGTMVAAVSLDSTGTTKMGTWVFNHSFMRPGLAATATSVTVGLLLARLLP
jgi:anaerobic C4-dicarboxylate transporter DcuA